MRRLRITPCGALVLAAAIVYFAVLWHGAPEVGYTRDEGYYFKAATQYGAWWDTLFSGRFLDAFGSDEIRTRFDYNKEHPALVKLAQGITHRVFHQWLGWVAPSMGYRITGFLFAGLSLLATFLLGRALVSASVGLLAALLLGTMPRYFFDAHLACFDVPITAMWTLSLWAFWRAYAGPDEGRLRRSVVAGIVFGLALATKLNGLFLPFVFVALWLVTGPVLGALRWVRGPSGGRDVTLPVLPWALVIAAVIGPLVFVAHWPWLWHDTAARIGGYVGFHMNHEHYPVQYFGQLLARPPFPVAFPFVMTAFTVPSPALVLGGLGLVTSVVRSVRRRSAEDVLLVIAALLPLVLIAMPSTPIFGGVKHWYTALPVLAVLAARAGLDGARVIACAVGEARLRWVQVALGAVMLAPGVLGIAASHPNGIGFYNELAGGFRGGAELGMQRGFWGGLARPVYDQLGAMSSGARVFFNRTNYDAYQMYQREGLIPRRVYYANDAKGATVGVHFEQPEHGEKEGEIWSNVGTRPVAGVYADNVTLIQLYVRGPSKAGPWPP